jgi:hypothetical protein
MQGSLHQAHIEQIVKTYGASTRSFRVRVQEFLKDTPGYGSEYDEDGIDGIIVPRVIPDAYQLRPGRITVWEIEITNPISPAKFGEYAAFWAELDATDIQTVFELRIVDRFGIERAWEPFTVYAAMLPELLPGSMISA